MIRFLSLSIATNFRSFLAQAQTPSKDEKKRKADGTPDGRGRKKKKQ